VHGVGTGLVARGHAVELLTGQPGGLTSRSAVDGLPVRYVRTPLPAVLARRGWTRETAFGAVAAVGSAMSGADAVVSYLYADAVGASLARHLPGRRGRRPLVLKLTGAVPLSWMQEHGRRHERALLRRALAAADEVWVNSQYVVEAMAGWGREMHVVPAGIDAGTFRPSADRDPQPLVLCTAAPEEPRKRLVDLLDAWRPVRDALPGARLVLAGAASAATQAALLERLAPQDRDSVRFVGLLQDGELVQAYSRAWVTVAPSVHEALGLVTLESLACGTPVAGADSGATPELLAAAGTGRLFQSGDPASLAEAVVGCATLAQQPGTREVCRRSTFKYEWTSIVDEVERRLSALLP
jgi:glycosyltransferase involved in cell wall biosynthesis